MKAVFRHELDTCFTNLTAYVFGAFLLLFAGIYTMVYNINYAVSNFEYVLSGMSFIFLIIVPILTMRVLAEEKKQKTDQLLYSLPLTMTQVVLGKYAALLCMLLLPLAIICLYPLVLTAFGTVYLPAAYGAICGFFFLGAALIAVGMFISSVTESQAVAAGLCFVVLLLNYFLASLAGFLSEGAGASLAALILVALAVALAIRLMTKNTTVALLTGTLLCGGLILWYAINSAAFEGLLPELLEKLSLFELFYTFVDGVFDLTAIVAFLTVIGVFLFLSVQSMEKRRWSE